MNTLERSIITSVAEVVACTGSRVFTLHQQIMLLGAGLRSEQLEVLKETLDLLREERKIILNWEVVDEKFHVQISDSLPLPEISAIDKERLSELRLRRILLFCLYDKYRKVGHRFVHVPLVSLAERLGVTSEEIFRHVNYLDSQYLLDYGLADGGQCTSDLTDAGIEVCENREQLFDKFSGMQTRIDGDEKPVQATGQYVSENRIAQLGVIEHPDFDLRKLVQLCKEANVAYAHGCLLSLAMIQRTIINHVPPIFGFRTFSEVVGKYSGGKSFKQLMERLESSLRRVADSHLHQVVRPKESLPEPPQVDFKTEIDVLLAEIVSRLEQQNPS